MKLDGMKAAILAALKQIAPEADLARLDPETPIRDQIDLDSIDYINFVLGVEQRLGVHLPDGQLLDMASLNGCLRALGGLGRQMGHV